MDGILHAIESRRARRAIDPGPVPAKTVSRLLDAAVLAPSCANKQSWRFLVLDSPQMLERARPHLSEGNYWAKPAPVLVLVLTRPEFGCRLDDRRDYAMFDCGLACMNLMLQAADEGLVAHPIAGYKPIDLKRVLGVPDEYILAAIIVIGKPGDPAHLNDTHRESESAPRSRKPFDAAVCFNEWTIE